jgi:Fe-S-cluster-containing dehydrogenase component
MQPEQFVEIGEALAKSIGVAAGDRVKVSSKRGHIKAVAVVTKRIKPLTIEGRKVHHVGLPIHWGFKGLTKPGYLANTLTPSWATATRRRRSSSPSWSRSRKHGGKPWHCNPWISSAAPPPRRPPRARAPRRATVAKLIDVSKCIGCKACQTACMEWNDLRDDVGVNAGVYDNPRDLTENSWTVMRFTEYENPQTGDLEWLIRKDGCMHCEDPGCLKACPSPGAIVQYTNGIVDFHEENCIGCGYCVTGCPFDVPRISKKDKRAYKCTLCSDRVGVGQEPACVKACPTGAICSAPRTT